MHTHDTKPETLTLAEVIALRRPAVHPSGARFDGAHFDGGRPAEGWVVDAAPVTVEPRELAQLLRLADAALLMPESAQELRTRLRALAA